MKRIAKAELVDQPVRLELEFTDGTSESFLLACEDIPERMAKVREVAGKFDCRFVEAINALPGKEWPA